MVLTYRPAAFAEAAAQQGITIMAVQHNAYCERFLLADSVGLADMLVDYDGKGRLKSVRGDLPANPPAGWHAGPWARLSMTCQVVLPWP